MKTRIEAVAKMKIIKEQWNLKQRFEGGTKTKANPHQTPLDPTKLQVVNLLSAYLSDADFCWKEAVV